MARLRKKLTAAEKARKKEQVVDPAAGDAAGEDAPKKQAPARLSAQKDSDKQPRPQQATSKVPVEPNIIQKSIQFIREVKVELKKVTWPNRKQTLGSTLVVIILVFIIASFLGLVDIGLSKLVQVVLA